jgi:hypothetical protein
MKRVLVASVASVVLLLTQFDEGFAAGSAGPFDGQWTGSAKSAVAQCKSAKVTVTVEGTVVIGQRMAARSAILDSTDAQGRAFEVHLLPTKVHHFGRS